MLLARNLEIKAVDQAPTRSAAACRRLGARDHGLIGQRDTYFSVRRGRLKLREEQGRAELIHYERSDVAEARESRYRRIEVADPPAVRAALSAALGIVAVVEKERHLFVWKTVRIHLDEVKGLGSFVELEAIASPGGDRSRERGLIAELRAALSIDTSRLVASSYCDQIKAIRG